MTFNKGSELDKQIYKEGDSTWGCKSGVLDVEDVKAFIKQVMEGIDRAIYDEKHMELGNLTIVEFIEERAGDGLLVNDEVKG